MSGPDTDFDMMLFQLDISQDMNLGLCGILVQVLFDPLLCEADGDALKVQIGPQLYNASEDIDMEHYKIAIFALTNRLITIPKSVTGARTHKHEV